MRIENNEPHRQYKNFADWLFNDNRHTIWIITLFFSYLFYLWTTTEV